MPSRLHEFWMALEPGADVTMDQMVGALREYYPGATRQAVRSALTALRKGGIVRDPGDPSQYLPRLFVWYHRKNKRYYDFGRLSGEAVGLQVPGNTLADIFGGLNTRVGNMNSTMGQHGAGRSREFLTAPEFRELVDQFPVQAIGQALDILEEALDAKRLLLAESIAGDNADLGSDTEDDS